MPRDFKRNPLFEEINDTMKDAATERCAAIGFRSKTFLLLKSRQRAIDYIYRLEFILNTYEDFGYYSSEYESISAELELFRATKLKIDKFLYNHFNIKYIPQ
ncbi:hypothetical protein NNC19_18045 [Clostridium sp. SHJSY1]|uniref:hypothetical protein n=1 Tax=Clostridium sp. SHJSY1 TaxID=2942483 RepID=UPI0028767A6D|nr:hypothetical protein [Clostridium sp. SHJSY1]MDS0527595.1 hypothetical protein [Clostridium sp. SHJSY1]